MFRISLVLAALGALGCTRAPERRPPPPRAVEILPDVPFDQLDRAQRAQLMKTHVLPAITPVFQRHDPKKFEVVDCKTCHAETSWTMPNRELAILDLDDLTAHEPADVEWMKAAVVPAMRAVLRDPALRCGRCHPIADSHGDVDRGR